MRSTPKLIEAVALGTVYPEVGINSAELQEPELGIAPRVKVKFPWLNDATD